MNHEILAKAERFIAGFEGDETQDGVDELLHEIRTALVPAPMDHIPFGFLGRAGKSKKWVFSTGRAFMEAWGWEVIPISTPVPKEPTEHKVAILWGQYREPDDKPGLYEFATAAELTAFLEGVGAMDGWMGYEVIE